MSNYDWNLMYAMHNALRREVQNLAKVAAREDDDPRGILGVAVGWELFKAALHAHHTAEDEAAWPVLRKTLEDRPDDLALLDAMEAEHEAIDPLIEAIDTGTEPVAGLVDALATNLTAHLEHEEKEAIPLMDATLTLEHFQNFGQVHGARVGPNGPRVIPWMLDGADDAAVAAMLAGVPEPVRATYRAEWRPAYEALTLWPSA